MLKLYTEPYDKNVWIEHMISYIPHIISNIEECDYIISSKIPMGCTNTQLIQDILLSYKEVNKKVIVFMVSDYNDALDVPLNILFFRTGMYKSHKKPNEYLIPHIWAGEGLNSFPPLPKKTQYPIVGFCGSYTSHPCRMIHINRINMAPDIKKKFILRNEYWAGKEGDKQVIDDFLKNIKETYFTLCSRGAGNWSDRFYKVMFLGRIPIVVNTDIVLPFEDKINWRDIIVYCDSDHDIANNIRNFWKKNIIESQIKCKEIYDTYLNPENWWKIIIDEILIPH